ncbi:MAG: DUF2806 domain-containing protein [Planctomycetota bacterium]|mgnify:CR=1 FL=1
MSSDETDSDQHKSVLPEPLSNDWLTRLGEIWSGIPKAFQRPLAKAFGRLILGIVDLPATYFETLARDMRAKQAAKEKVSRALAKAAAARIADRPEISDRALEHFTAEIIGKQANREAVFRHTVADLQLSASTPEASEFVSGTEIDDDWLTAFASHAERATSDRLQALFGRILAGEIRQANSFSLFTLDLLSKMSKREAEMIVQIAPFVVGSSVLLTARSRSALNFILASRLGEIGILTSTSIGVGSACLFVDTSEAVPYHGKPSHFLINQDRIFFIVTTTPKRIEIPCAILTLTGREVLNLHNCEIDEVMLNEFAADLKKQDAVLVTANITERMADGAFKWNNAHPVIPNAIELPT